MLHALIAQTNYSCTVSIGIHDPYGPIIQWIQQKDFPSQDISRIEITGTLLDQFPRIFLLLPHLEHVGALYIEQRHIKALYQCKSIRTLTIFHDHVFDVSIFRDHQTLKSVSWKKPRNSRLYK